MQSIICWTMQKMSLVCVYNRLAPSHTMVISDVKVNTALYSTKRGFCLWPSSIKTIPFQMIAFCDFDPKVLSISILKTSILVACVPHRSGQYVIMCSSSAVVAGAAFPRFAVHPITLPKKHMRRILEYSGRCKPHHSYQHGISLVA